MKSSFATYYHYLLLLLLLVFTSEVKAETSVTQLTYSKVSDLSVIGGTENWNGADSEESLAKLVDNNTDTKWCATGSTFNVILDAQTATSLIGYSFTTGGDTSGNTGRNPVSWTLYGSNDANAETNSTWKEVETQTDNVTMPATDKTEQRFFLKHISSSYRYYKFAFTKVSSGTLIQLSELSLLTGSPAAGWDYNSSNNMWKAVDQGTPTYEWYMADNNWGNESTTAQVTHSTNQYSFAIPDYVGNTQWQAQVAIKTSSLNVTNNTYYKFYVTLESDKNIDNVTVKISDNDNSGNYLPSDRFNIKEGINLVRIANVKMSGGAAASIELRFDFAGGAGANIVASNIYLAEMEQEYSLDMGLNYALVKLQDAGGNDIGYLDSDFKVVSSKDDAGIIHLQKQADGTVLVQSGSNTLSYNLYGNMFKDEDDNYYIRGDWDAKYTDPQMQYYSGKSNEVGGKIYPRLNPAVEEKDISIDGNNLGSTENNAISTDGKAITGYWGAWANRFCKFRIMVDGSTSFILKDDAFQNNSRPMSLTDSGACDVSPYVGYGVDFEAPLYFEVIDNYVDDGSSVKAGKILHPIVNNTNAVKFAIEDVTMSNFEHYEGDVYSGKIGSDIPDDLQYSGGSYKSHADDGRILPEADPIQRTHEYEKEVWVFPGKDYELLPYSDFKSATQYEEKYTRWYDYTTGKKSSNLDYGSQTVVSLDKGILGGSELTGDRTNGTSMIYRSGAETTSNVWPISPFMTHVYTPKGVEFKTKVYDMSDVTGATIKKYNSGAWEDDGTVTKADDKVTVQFTGTETQRRVFIEAPCTVYENSVDYKLHVKVKSNRNMSGVKLYPLEIEGAGFDKEPELFDLTANEEKELEYQFSEGINGNGYRIWFDNVTALNGDNFEVCDIYITKGEVTQEPLNITQKDNSYKFSLAATTERWRAIVDFKNVDIDIKKGFDYTFKFTVNSSSALKKNGTQTNGLDNGGIFVKIEDSNNPGIYLFDDIVEVSDAEAGTDKEVVISIPSSGAEHLTSDITNCRLIFDFGSNPATDIELKNIVLLAKSDTKLAETMDIIAMDASCSFEYFTNVKETGNTLTVVEPNISFRTIFVVKNAKLRADIMSDKTKGSAYVEAHKEELMAPTGTPFQYRLQSGDFWDFNDNNKYPTDFWYKTSDTEYAQVYHYLIETWKKDSNGDYQLLGKTINFKDGEDGENQYYGTKPTNLDQLAQLNKARNYRDRVFYIKDPQEGEYQIKFYAITNTLKNASAGSGADRANPIYYYGESASDENRMELMEYDLTVLPLTEGNMILEETLKTNNDYAHQRPAKMKELYGEPTTVVNFDDVDKSKCELDGSGDGYYKWPRKWEESSYAFPYDPGDYDYNMYVVSNRSKYTHYHEAATADTYDRAYVDSEGKKKGFFYYTNAAGDPGRMTILNIGKDFCARSTVYVSAWVMEFSKTNETANVVFSFKGVDVNNNETTLNSFVTGYVTGGSNKLSDGTNVDNRGKWHHVYYSFHPDNITGKTFDHYIISVENNCVSSDGADYAIDDIQAFVCKPTLSARQSKPYCNGEKETNLIMMAEYDQIMNSFGGFTKPADSDHGVTASFDYCFLDKAKYDEIMTDYVSYTDATDKLACYEKAFNSALIKDAYGPSHTTYGVLEFNTWYASNADYDNKNEYAPGNNHDASYLNKATKYTDSDTDKKFLVFPSYANDAKMVVGKEYIVAMVEHTGSDHTANDFAIYDACSSSSEFTVITSGQVKVDGELASAQNGANVCANTIPVITIDMSGIGNLGAVQTTEQAYFDWYFDTYSNYSSAKYTTGANVEVGLYQAMTRFRGKYPVLDQDHFAADATPTSTGKDDFTANDKECIQSFLTAGTLVLYKNSEVISTYSRLGEVLGPDDTKSYYVTAIPINPTPESDVLKYCLEPFQITLNLSTRTPRMKNGDDHGLIPYPSGMVDVPLRIGLSQLNRVRMTSLKATPSNFLYMPLRDVTPATSGVKSLIQKAKDDYVYLAASTDPNVAAGTSGAVDVEGYTKSDVKVIGKVSDITADYSTQGNVCHLAFLSGFKFREGYEYTIKFHFEENYTGVTDDHSDVCPGDVVCTIKVVPEYQMWTGQYSRNWNDDRNWRRVTRAELFNPTVEDVGNDFVTDGGTNDRTFSYAPADFTKVIIPAGTPYTPYMYDMREASNLTEVNFTGAPSKTNYVNMSSPDGALTTALAKEIGATTNLVKFDMASVDRSDGNVACRTWYDNTCDQIHFMSGAEIMDQRYIHYNKAWCDITVATGRWQTISSPLTKIVAGDLYLPSDNASQDTPLFQDITYDTSKNDRFKPAVYQRSWNKGTAKVYELDGTTSESAVALDWSHVYNDVNENYDAGVGFSIKVDASAIGSNPVTTYNQTEIGHLNASNADANSFVLMSIYSDGAGNTTVKVEQDAAKNTSMFDYLQVTGLTSTGTDVTDGGSNDMSVTFTTPTADADGNITLEILWSTVNWDGRWMVQNVKVPANAVLPNGPGAMPQTAKFRLPKADTSYTYYNPGNTDGDKKTDAVIDAAKTDGKRPGSLTDLSSTFEKVVGGGTNTGTQYFLVGNPLMCYLDMTEFFSENTQFATKYWLVTAEGQKSATLDVTRGTFISSTDITNNTYDARYVKPGQSFFVELSSGTATSETPKFTNAMMYYETGETATSDPDLTNITQAGNDPVDSSNAKSMTESNSKPARVSRKSQEQTVDDIPALYISATAADGCKSSAVLTDAESANIDGAEMLLDSNLSDDLFVYAAVNGKAMSIGSISEGDTIAVAATGRQENVVMKIKGAASFDYPLYLIDTELGTVRALENDTVLNVKANGIRYYITSIAEDEAVAPTMPRIVTDGCTLTAYAPDGEAITRLNIFSTDGACVVRETDITDSYSVTLPEGVYLVEIVTPTYHQTLKFLLHE